MITKYRLELIDWDERKQELAKFTDEGWKPIAISKTESMTTYVDAVVVLFSKEEE